MLKGKQLHEISDEDMSYYKICEICKRLYLLNEISMFYPELPHVGRCIFCTSVEREEAMKKEEEKKKLFDKDQKNKFNKYIDSLAEHP